MSNILKIAIIATVVVYSSGLVYTYYSNKQFQQEVAVFDLDKNGALEYDELTKESIGLAKQQERRKTTKQGAIVLIPVSLVIGVFVYGIAFLFRKIKRTNDNAIFYRNTNF